MEEKITFDDVLDGTEDISWEILDESNFDIVTSEDSNTVAGDVEDDEEDDAPGADPNDVSFEDLEDESESDDDDEGSGDGDAEDADDGDEAIEYIAREWESKNLIYIPEGMEVKTEEDLDKVIEATITRGIEEYKSSFQNETTKNFISFVEQGGNPTEFIETVAQSNYQNFDNIEAEEDKLQVIKDMYSAQGITGVRAERLLTAVEDDGAVDTEFEAAKAFFKEAREENEKALVAAQEKRNKDAQEAQQRKLDGIKNTIHNVEAIRDIPLKTEASKKELENYIFNRTEKYTDEAGNSFMITKYQKDKLERAKNANAEFEDILFDALITLKGTTPIQQIGVTKHTKKFRDIAKRHKNQSTSSKLQSGGKSSPSRGSKTTSFDDWANLD